VGRDISAQLGTCLNFEGVLRDALGVAVEIVAALDQYGIDLQLLEQPRRWLIYTLLSFRLSGLTEAYRIAFLLFVHMVIYPLPGRVHLDRLCRSLLQILAGTDQWISPGMTWILVMGGICSTASDHDAFAQSFVSQHTARFQVWQDLESLMSKCLWSAACHDIGYGFWQTCCLKRAFLW
jgi:Na+/H+-dicarboxylate symporter